MVIALMASFMGMPYSKRIAQFLVQIGNGAGNGAIFQQGFPPLYPDLLPAQGVFAVGHSRAPHGVADYHGPVLPQKPKRQPHHGGWI